ncbi:MAG: hypothetical protein QOF31_412, partial [Mycobacterium sp.]|nr:hypothetical protein [Mycobacterium sp.]
GLRLLTGTGLAAGVFTDQWRISKGRGSAGTTGQQATSHEAGRSGDAHTRTHFDTTLQGATGPAIERSDHSRTTTINCLLSR